MKSPAFKFTIIDFFIVQSVKKAQKTPRSLVILVSVLFGACSGGNTVEPSTDTDSGSDTTLDSDTDPHSDADTDSDIDSDTDTDSDTDKDSDTDTDSDTDSDSDTHSDADRDSDTDSDADTDSDTPVDTAPPEHCVIHVNAATGDDGNTGLSWSTPKANISHALVSADHFECPEIWVAEGEYKPTTRDAREVSMQLLQNTALYGGFSGDETSLNQRDVDRYPTILSGEIGAPDSNEDNSLHVVTGANQARLDGFTITKGSDETGSAVYNEGVSFIIANCRFIDNARGLYFLDSRVTITNSIFENNRMAIGMFSGSLDAERVDFINNNGSAIHLNQETVLNVRDCRFENNQTGVGGGAISAGQLSNITIIDSHFVSNVALGEGIEFEREGGAIHSRGVLNIDSTVFESNSSYNHGGAIYFSGKSIVITNSEFTGNTSQMGPVLYLKQAVTAEISGCDFTDNEGVGAIFTPNNPIGPPVVLRVTESNFENNRRLSGSNGAGAAVTLLSGNSDSLFSHCTFRRNQGAIRFHMGLSVSNCLFDENEGSAIQMSPVTSPSYIMDSTFINNRATLGAAFHHSGASQDTPATQLSRCTFKDNAATEYGGALHLIGAVDIRDTLITGNSAEQAGGALYIASPQLDIEESLINIYGSTVYGNSSLQGDALFASGIVSDHAAQVTVANSIIRSNAYRDPYQSQPSYDIRFSNIEDLLSGEGNIDDSPEFEAAPLAVTVSTEPGTEDTVIASHYTGIVLNGFTIELNNDGIARTVTSVTGDAITFEPALDEPTVALTRVDIWGTDPPDLNVDFHLTPESPCIDSGDDTVVLESVDLDGNPRIVGAHVDMGAYESQ